jgi:U3 small nucleolar RNA-associated protein 4
VSTISVTAHFAGVTDKGVTHQRSLARVEARLLSVAWHPNRTVVFVGSSDGCARCWDVRSGEELLRITLARGGSATLACVWSVLVLPSGVLATGDSEGRTSLWDGTHGTLLHSFTAHAADVLALACTPAGDVLFSAGVDSKVAIFGTSPAEQPAPWSLLGYKRVHTHDVRALALAPYPPAALDAPPEDGQPPPAASMLLSGGTDAQLLAYAAENFLGEHPVRVVRTPPSPIISIATSTGPLQPLLLCTHITWLDVWRLGSCANARDRDLQVRVCLPRAALRRTDASAQAPTLELASAPVHLARIRVRCRRHLLSSAISASGKLVAASDAYAPHIFAMDLSSKRKVVTKRSLDEKSPPALVMVCTR